MLHVPPLPSFWSCLVTASGVPGTTGALLRLSWISADGNRKMQEVPLESGDGCKLVLPLDIRHISPVLAEVVLLRDGHEYELLPAGGVYPFSRDQEGNLLLSWEDGWAAEVLMQVGGTGFPLEGFHVARFLEAAVPAGGGNPWRLDAVTAGEAIAAGEFNARCFRKLPEAAVLIPFPPGIWIPDNTLRGICAVSVGEDAPALMLPDGLHHFFKLYDISRTVSVSVSGGRAVIRLP